MGISNLLQTLLSASVVAAASGSGSQEKCQAFEPSAPNTLILSTTYFPPNATVKFTSPENSVDTEALPGFCRIAMQVTTNETAKSFTSSEIWLPDDWNGRFLGLGPGGWGGYIVYSDLAFAAVNQGFAGHTSNLGHNSTALDASWALNNPNALIDKANRANHMSSVVGQAITKDYYDVKTNMRSYFMSCSDGGRQGLHEAFDFPEDYDGIVIGSPDNFMTHLQDWSIHINLLTKPAGGPTDINAAQWQAIHEEVLAQCDALDGVEDGILTNPLDCHFRPEEMTCKPGQDANTCLTTPQIGALKQIYADYYDVNQTFVFGGLNPGGELNYFTGLNGETPLPISTGYFQFMIFNRTDWTEADYNPDTILIADSINPGGLNAVDPDLTKFMDRGGKVLHYVGLSDQLISPRNSFHFYESVVSFLRQSGSKHNIDDTYRLFPVPGMTHCSGGAGANAFGQDGLNPALSPSPKDNALFAVIDWVENGRAPSSIRAVKYVNDSPEEGVAFTRPLCPHPQRQVFVGGDVNESTSFACTFSSKVVSSGR